MGKSIELQQQIVKQLKNSKKEIETKLLLYKKENNIIVNKLKNNINELKKNEASLQSRQKNLIHKFKKSELDCKNLRIRLNAKLEKVQKRKYNFCLNTEKIISDFYDENKVKSKDKNAFKKRLETNLAILEKEN